MIPNIIINVFEPCICIDGPLKNHVDKIACLGINAPCDCKYFPGEKDFIKYKLKCINKIWQKDSEGRYKLYYKKE